MIPLSETCIVYYSILIFEILIISLQRLLGLAEEGDKIMYDF